VMKQDRKGNRPFFTLTMLVISHAFNRIFEDKESLEEIFKAYLEEKAVKAEEIDYSDLRMWLSRQRSDKLIEVSNAVINLYLKPS
jgi:hypothetical protein